MAIIITDECINCGACEPECPNNAIYDAGAAWRFSDGTGLRGVIDFLRGQDHRAQDDHAVDVSNEESDGSDRSGERQARQVVESRPQVTAERERCPFRNGQRAEIV